MPAQHLRWPVTPRAPAARPVTQLALGAVTTSSLGDCLPSLPRGSQPAPRGGLSLRRPLARCRDFALDSLHKLGGCSVSCLCCLDSRSDSNLTEDSLGNWNFLNCSFLDCLSIGEIRCWCLHIFLNSVQSLENFLDLLSSGGRCGYMAC